MGWSDIFSGLGSAIGGYYQGQAYKDAATTAAASADKATAMQQAQIDAMTGYTETARTRGNEATDLMATATGLNGTDAQTTYAESLANDPNYLSQQAFADRKTNASINSQGGSTLGGNALSSLHAADTAGLNTFAQQRYTNLGTLETGGLSALTPLASVMNTSGTGAANSTISSGLSTASGITNSANSTIGGLQAASKSLSSSTGSGSGSSGSFSGSTALT